MGKAELHFGLIKYDAVLAQEAGASWQFLAILRRFWPTEGKYRPRAPVADFQVKLMLVLGRSGQAVEDENKNEVQRQPRKNQRAVPPMLALVERTPLQWAGGEMFGGTAQNLGFDNGVARTFKVGIGSRPTWPRLHALNFLPT
jgi:hypothetical protein